MKKVPPFEFGDCNFLPASKLFSLVRNTLFLCFHSTRTTDASLRLSELITKSLGLVEKLEEQRIIGLSNFFLLGT